MDVVNDIVDYLSKENRAMPRGCIEDLVRMYNKMTPEQREQFNEEMDKLDPNPMEKCIDNELDATSVLHFTNAQDADDYLRSEGKLEADANEDIYE